MHASRGRTDEALDWLERAFEDRDPNLLYLTAIPHNLGLQAHARYTALFGRIGLYPDESP